MIGAICRRDILAHPFVTVRCFGWRVFFRALVANHNQTFLTLLAETGSLRPQKTKIPEMVDRCIKLELQAQRIYHRLARRFLDKELTNVFFDSLAYQEKTHAELLELCHEAARRSVWNEECAPRHDTITRLERQMADAEASLDSTDSVADALLLVIWIEKSEVNRAFESIVEACGSEFVRKVRAFQSAVTEHVVYICKEITRLEPQLAGRCEELARAHRVVAD